MKSIDCWININTPVLVLFTPVFWNGLSVVVWSSITLVVELMTILLAFKGSASRDRSSLCHSSIDCWFVKTIMIVLLSPVFWNPNSLSIWLSHWVFLAFERSAGWDRSLLLHFVNCWIDIDTPVDVLLAPVFWNGFVLVIRSSRNHTVFAFEWITIRDRLSFGLDVTVKGWSAIVMS